jgi:hypothetical protein
VRVAGDDAEVICPISAEVIKEGEWAARMPCGHYFGKGDLFEVCYMSNLSYFFFLPCGPYFGKGGLFEVCYMSNLHTVCIFSTARLSK